MPSVHDSLSHDSDSVAEALSAMIEKEQTVYKSCDYLSSVDDDCNSKQVVTTSDRQIICDWCYSIVDACQFDRETVALAMEMIDRFLSQPSITTHLYLNNRKQYQLLAMGCLYIAIKAHEPVAFASEMFASMSNGLYTISDIEDMEKIILHGLQWRTNAPTSVQMAYHILSLVFTHLRKQHTDDTRNSIEETTWCYLLDETRYQVEYALRDYAFSVFERPSTIALAAILNSLDQVDRHERSTVLRTLLLVMDENFASSKRVYNVKKRLTRFVENNDTNCPSPSEVSSSSANQDSSSSRISVEIASNSSTTTRSGGSPRTSTWTTGTL